MSLPTRSDLCPRTTSPWSNRTRASSIGRLRTAGRKDQLLRRSRTRALRPPAPSLRSLLLSTVDRNSSSRRRQSQQRRRPSQQHDFAIQFHPDRRPDLCDISTLLLPAISLSLTRIAEGRTLYSPWLSLPSFCLLRHAIPSAFRPLQIIDVPYHHHHHVHPPVTLLIFARSVQKSCTRVFLLFSSSRYEIFLCCLPPNRITGPLTLREKGCHCAATTRSMRG